MYDLALEHYLTANKLAEGKEAWIVANIGNIYNGRGFHSQAIRHLREAITLDPESQYAYERLGRALKSQSQQIEARRELLSKAKATLAAQTEQAALPAGQPSQETPR